VKILSESLWKEETHGSCFILAQTRMIDHVSGREHNLTFIRARIPESVLSSKIEKESESI